MNPSRLEEWLAAYRSAWEGRDPEQAAALFSAKAEYYETPYAEPFRGPEGVKAYWARVTEDQRDVEFRSETVGVIDNTGIARWSATFRLESTGARVELNGVFLLEFDDDGQCAVLREWWHAR